MTNTHKAADPNLTFRATAVGIADNGAGIHLLIVQRATGPAPHDGAFLFHDRSDGTYLIPESRPRQFVVGPLAPDEVSLLSAAPRLGIAWLVDGTLVEDREIRLVNPRITPTRSSAS